MIFSVIPGNPLETEFCTNERSLLQGACREMSNSNSWETPGECKWITAAHYCAVYQSTPALLLLHITVQCSSVLLLCCAGVRLLSAICIHLVGHAASRGLEPPCSTCSQQEPLRIFDFLIFLTAFFFPSFFAYKHTSSDWMICFNTVYFAQKKFSSVTVNKAWNVVTLHGHAHPAVTSWFLYSMPDEHLGSVDRARHDSVGVHTVSLR